MRTITILSFCSVALLAAACASGPADGSGASVVEDTADSAEVTDTDEATEDDPSDDDTTVGQDGENDTDADGDGADSEDDAASADADETALGTRDNPLEVGTRIEMGEWSLAVTEVDLDATDRVMEANEFNDPPVDGRQFVLFEVEATYEGEDSGTAWLDFSWAIVGAAGNTFSTGSDDYCGVIPDALDDTGETFSGGSVSGNVCFSVDADQIEGGTIRIEESLSFDDTRAFYALD